MEYSAYHPTPEEIRLVQELAPGTEDVSVPDVSMPSEDDIRKIHHYEEGWREIWDGISKELAVRLPSAAKNCLRRFGGREFAENHYEDFAQELSRIFEEKIREKKDEEGEKFRTTHLFASYNHQKAKGDVYAWLCSPTNMLHYRDDFLEKELGYRITRYKDEETGKKKRKYVPPKQIPLDKKGEEIDNEDSRACRNDKFTASIPEWFKLDNLILMISQEIREFELIESQAGIQLYPRLDTSDDTMRRLMKQVRDEVSDEIVSHSNPDETIREEHDAAIDRLELKINKYEANLTDPETGFSRNVHTKNYKDNARKRDDALEEMFAYPLDAKQLMRLLSLTRANADNRRSNYIRKWKELLGIHNYQWRGGRQ